MIKTDDTSIKTVTTRGVERVFPNEEFLVKRLRSGEQLTIYLGIDPTGPTLHMGHMIPIIKLAQLQEMGHKIILLIGDFTACIGDPDKSQARKVLTHREVLENAKVYQEQASVVLNFEGENPAELKYNNDWLGKMNFSDVLNLASQMTVQQMLERDMFRKRFYGTIICDGCKNEFPAKPIESKNREGSIFKNIVSELECPRCKYENKRRIKKKDKTPIYLHEFMYPLMQGYDSVVMNVDGEVGGNDQTFNMLVGRDMLKSQTPPKEKFVIPMKLLVDNNGDKMGKTTGNMLSLLDSAEEKFKKIMTWPDDMLKLGFELLTNIDLITIGVRLKSDENPRNIKFDLAQSIVARFHSEPEAINSKQSWINDVQKDNIPDEIPEIIFLVDIIETLSIATGESKSQTRRLLEEGAIKLNGQKIDDESIKLSNGDLVQIGKKKWFKII
jgi:tyrosyl-tRNA synthetase